jgi:hypothetical protein
MEFSPNFCEITALSLLASHNLVTLNDSVSLVSRHTLDTFALRKFGRSTSMGRRELVKQESCRLFCKNVKCRFLDT